MQFKQYPSYKPSGVEWLGDVPEHWHVANIKRSTYLKGRVGWKGLTSNEFEVESYAYLVTGTDFKNKYVEWSFCYQVNEERFNDDPYIQLKNNDLLITKDGTIGKLAVVKDLDKPACLNSGIFLIRPEKYYLSEYMYYILKSSVFKNFFEIHSTGSTILHLYQNVFEKFSFAYPSFNEQKKIVSFLDTETTRIDNLIAKQEKLIELLEEQRKSIISHAVTKGLNPNAPMKDSGVEWLGEVPEHWQILKLRQLVKLESGSALPLDRINPDGKYPVYGGNNIRGFTENFNMKGDYILVGRQGSLCGNINYASGEFWATEHAVVVYPKKPVSLTFLGELLRTMNLNQYSIASAQAGLSVDRISNIYTIYIPFEEQIQIAKKIDHENLKVDKLISKQQSLIEKLKEYRASIISHAVTGKIDVREFGA